MAIRKFFVADVVAMLNKEELLKQDLLYHLIILFINLFFSKLIIFIINLLKIAKHLLMVMINESILPF